MTAVYHLPAPPSVCEVSIFSNFISSSFNSFLYVPHTMCSLVLLSPFITIIVPGWHLLPRLSPFFNSTENKHKQIASSCSPNHPSCLCECIPCLKGTWCVSVFELHKKSWKPPSVTSQITTPTRERIDGGVVAQWPDTSPHTSAGFGRSGQSTHFDTVLSRWMTVYTVLRTLSSRNPPWSENVLFLKKMFKFSKMFRNRYLIR